MKTLRSEHATNIYFGQGPARQGKRIEEEKHGSARGSRCATLVQCGISQSKCCSLRCHYEGRRFDLVKKLEIKKASATSNMALDSNPSRDTTRTYPYSIRPFSLHPGSIRSNWYTTIARLWRVSSPPKTHSSLWVSNMGLSDFEAISYLTSAALAIGHHWFFSILPANQIKKHQETCLNQIA